MRKKIGIYECMWLILGRPSKPLTQKTILDDLEGQGHKCNPSNNQFIHLLQSLNCDKQRPPTDFEYIFYNIHCMCYLVWLESNFPLTPHYSNDSVDVLF